MPDANINYGLATYSLGPQDRSIASLSGASQQLMPANPDRRAFFIENNGAAAMAVTFTKAVAAIGAAGCITIAPGASLSASMPGEQVPKGACFIIGTSTQSVYAEETYGYPQRA